LIDYLRWAWPDVRWESGAHFATQQGVFAGAFIVCIECSKIGLSLLTVRPVIDAVNVIGVVAFTLIAYGIHKRSRIAAVLGLALYLMKAVLGLALHLVEKADLPSGTDYPLWMLQLVMVVMFVNAARGTFAYRRYHKAVTG
jgi:hypothetical protein